MLEASSTAVSFDNFSLLQELQIVINQITVKSELHRVAIPPKNFAADATGLI